MNIHRYVDWFPQTTSEPQIDSHLIDNYLEFCSSFDKPLHFMGLKFIIFFLECLSGQSLRGTFYFQMSVTSQYSVLCLSHHVMWSGDNHLHHHQCWHFLLPYPSAQKQQHSKRKINITWSVTTCFLAAIWANVIWTHTLTHSDTHSILCSTWLKRAASPVLCPTRLEQMSCMNGPKSYFGFENDSRII